MVDLLPDGVYNRLGMLNELLQCIYIAYMTTHSAAMMLNNCWGFFMHQLNKFLENIVCTFGGRHFQRCRRSKCRPKSSSAAENIVCTFRAIFLAPQALENIVCTFGEAFQRCRRSKYRLQTVFGNRKHCLHVLVQYFEHRRRWKTLFALLGEAFSALQAPCLSPVSREVIAPIAPDVDPPMRSIAVVCELISVLAYRAALTSLLSIFVVVLCFNLSVRLFTTNRVK